MWLYVRSRRTVPKNSSARRRRIECIWPDVHIYFYKSWNGRISGLRNSNEITLHSTKWLSQYIYYWVSRRIEPTYSPLCWLLGNENLGIQNTMISEFLGYLSWVSFSWTQGMMVLVLNHPIPGIERGLPGMSSSPSTWTMSSTIWPII